MRALIFPLLTRTTRSLCGPKQSHAFNASNTTRFSSRLSNFCNFTPRIHQKQSQKVRNLNLSWGRVGGGHASDPSSWHATHALIAYWNPPFQNSRSATVHACSIVLQQLSWRYSVGDIDLPSLLYRPRQKLLIH